MTKIMERQRIISSIFTGGKAGLGEWCDRCRLTQDAIQILKDEDEAELQKAAETYNSRKIAEMRKEKESDQSIFADAVKSRLREDLEETLAAKGAAFHKACGAPSEENVRLLQVLKMRDTVSAPEIAEAAGHLAGNLVALGVLAEVAKANNVYFPKIPTDYRTACNEARKAAERVIACVGENTSTTDDSPLRKVKYEDVLFFHKNGNNSFMKPFIETIDKPGFLNVEEIKPKKSLSEEIRDSVAQGVAFAIENIGSDPDADA